MYDAIVVGARCAGSPVSMLLARKGYRVLLVDRATFPSDTISTHIIWQSGMAFLSRWGLLERLAATGCPSIPSVQLDLGPVTLEGTPPPIDGVDRCFAPRRTVLDKLLIDAAAEAGVEVREHFTVQEIVMDGDRVTGIRGRTHEGASVVEQARIVIGADGVHSTVATAVRAQEYNTKPAVTCWYYTYFSGVPSKGIEFYARDRRAIGAIPTHGGLICCATAWPHSEFHDYRADVEGNFRKTVDLAGGRLGERVRAGKQEERFYGMPEIPNFYRKPYGPGWALVGDSAYDKDPICAQGISDAFSSAELLAQAIDDGFSRRRPIEEALAQYENVRNTETAAMYEFNFGMATLEPPPPDILQLFHALRSNQHQTDRFFGTIAGTVKIADFFSPENTQKIIEGSAAGA
jgi:flavin-dependent dehydrogenase